MTRIELAKNIYNVSYLTGSFLLRSGEKSTEYFDKYKFESQPNILIAISEQLSPLVPKDTEVLAGLEMGGIPIATALSLTTGLPVTFVRKKAKEYGTCQFAEGANIRGKKVLIIEDIITSGGQVVLSTNDLRTQGALIDHVLCVIDRSQGKSIKLTEEKLKVSSLFTMEEIKKIVS